jgi:endonuclease/exonuclease/phosphatase family metal-dependent hydrolase
MPEHQPLPNAQPQQLDSIRLLQIDLNKLECAHLDIINERVSQRFDIILIQEPYGTIFNAIRTPTNFRPIFPSHRIGNEGTMRSVIWVNSKLDTKNWMALDVPGTNDIMAIQLKGPYGTLSIFNVYNDCTHSRNETTLRRYIHENTNLILATENHHMMWAGDFNRHHLLWDRDEDTHLFTQLATRQAENLIELLATYELEMPLPKGVPTLQHMVTGRYSRPDNVFCTANLTGLITLCKVDPTLRPPSTDHFPVITRIVLPQERIVAPPFYNFREVDWEKFLGELKVQLDTTPNPRAILNQEELDSTMKRLTQAIQDTIEENVTKAKPRPDTKRWWNGDLTRMKKELNRIRALSFRYRAIADHFSHEELRKKKQSIWGRNHSGQKRTLV